MIELHAPAKLNLTLEVLGRRDDGYHAIASIMHTLSLHDTLILTPVEAGSTPIQIEVDGFAVPTDERNLVWRALECAAKVARASQPCFAWASRPSHKMGWHVRLIKRIPTEAGLGGGSSDAAAILRHFGGHALAPQLGSDVSFFLNGACARVEGRGERVKPLPALPPFWWTLAKPLELGVPTAWAYAQLNRPPLELANTPPWISPLVRGARRDLTSPTDRLEHAILQGAIRTPDDLVPFLHNDFEAVVLPAFEPLQRLRARMEALSARRVLLCGSGSAQAALCETQTDAERMADALRAEGYWAVAVQLGL